MLSKSNKRTTTVSKCPNVWSAEWQRPSFAMSITLCIAGRLTATNWLYQIICCLDRKLCRSRHLNPIWGAASLTFVSPRRPFRLRLQLGRSPPPVSSCSFSCSLVWAWRPRRPRSLSPPRTPPLPTLRPPWPRSVLFRARVLDRVAALSS